MWVRRRVDLRGFDLMSLDAQSRFVRAHRGLDSPGEDWVGTVTVRR